MAMITQIEDFFDMGCGRCARFATDQCSARVWGDGLLALRRICLEMGLTEAVKWGHPCYTHAGRNIAPIGAQREDFRLSFFNAAVMTDPDGLMERQGPNTRNPDSIRFTDVAQVVARQASLRAYLAEAKSYAAAGIKAKKVAAEIELPNELVEAMDADPKFADAFHGLTPGRQRSYVIGLSSTTTAATRLARTEKFRSRVIAGKGANEY